MEFSRDGEVLYVCAFGSGAVGVLDPRGRVIDRIPVGRGPSGLALDEVTGRLYVMNRFDHEVSVIDLEARREVCAVPLRHDPEAVEIRDGRAVFYDARGGSGHGDAACGSCHIFGDTDGLAWDLGDPNGPVKPNHLVRAPHVAHVPRLPFHPMRGPMLTMSLRGLRGAGAMHWRGDANGGPEHPFDEEIAFEEQWAAFRTLLGRAADPHLEDLHALRIFVLALRYPPNPIPAIDGSLTTLQSAGRQIFESEGNPNRLGGSGVACTTCHVPPLGTDGHSVRGRSQDFKVPHLRGLYQRIGMFGYGIPGIIRFFPWLTEDRPTPHLGEQVRGFGFTNDGSVPTLRNFLDRPIGQFAFLDEPGRSGLDKMRELEAWLLAYPTGLAPVVGQQVTIDAESADDAVDRLRLLAERSVAGDGDLVIHGPWLGEQRGWCRDPGAPGWFLSDRAGERATVEDLVDIVRSGAAVLTAVVAPPGCGMRIGIDRDEDGAFDGDEVSAGSDPADRGSTPAR
jgi:hypothetical protein